MHLQMTSLKALVASAVLASAAVVSAQAPSSRDLVGTWNVTLTSPQGTHPSTLTIKEEAGQLSGSLSGEMGTTTVAVTTSDAGVKLSFSIDYQGQPLPILLTGRLADGALEGTVDYGNGAAAGDFKGRKGEAGTGAATSGAASLTGTWLITADEAGWSMELTQDGTAVSGTLRNADRGVALPLKGTLQDGAVDLAITGEATGTITGTFDGAGLKGSYSVDGNAGSWSATRKS